MNNLKILILNYNSALETVALFKNLRTFNLRDTEINVIDNNSKPEDQKILKDQIPLKYLIFNKTNVGYAGGNNIGISSALQSNFKFVLLLNPDIRLDKSCILELLDSIKINENIAVIGPRICYRESPDLIFSDGGLILKEKAYEAPHLNYNQKINDVKNPGLHEVDYVSGSCFLLRTDVIEEVGNLREDFFLYYEETEWCLRVKRYNKKCMVNSNCLAFLQPSPKNKNYYFYMTRNRLLLARIDRKNVVLSYKLLIRSIGLEIYKKIKHRKKPSSLTLAKAKGVLLSIAKHV